MATFYTYNMIRHFHGVNSGSGGHIVNDNCVKLAGQFSTPSRGNVIVSAGSPRTSRYIDVFPARAAIFADGAGFISAKSGSREAAYKHFFGRHGSYGVGRAKALFGNSQLSASGTGSGSGPSHVTNSIGSWLPICSLPPYGPFVVSARVAAWGGRGKFAAAEVVVYGVNATIKKVEKVSSYAQELSTSDPSVAIGNPGSNGATGSFQFTVRGNALFATYCGGGMMKHFSSAIPNAPWQRKTSNL